MINQQPRKRRTRSELVWTQPRTIPPGMHMNISPLCTGPKQQKADSPPSDTASENNKSTHSRKKSQQRHSPTRTVKRSSLNTRTSVTPSWDNDALLAHLDFNTGITEDFTMPDLVRSQTAPLSPAPSLRSSSLQSTGLDTPDSTFNNTIGLPDLDNLEPLPPTIDELDPVILDASMLFNGDNTLANSCSTTSSSTNLDYMGATGLGLNLDDCSSREFKGYNAVHLAAHYGQHSMVRLLLLACPERPIYTNALNDYGQTALHVAAGRGHVDVVQQLLNFGADATLQDNEGQTALHAATMSGSLNTLQLLLDHDMGAKLAHMTDVAGQTPLHRAVMQGNEDVVRLLLSRGADLGAMVG